jgi:hypothetical protein
MHPDTFNTIFEKVSYLVELFKTMNTSWQIDATTIEKIEANKNDVGNYLKLLKSQSKTISDLNRIKSIENEFNKTESAYKDFVKKYHKYIDFEYDSCKISKEGDVEIPKGDFKPIASSLEKLVKKGEKLQGKCLEIMIELEKEASNPNIF